MVEDAYAYSVFARRALGTNDIDFRPERRVRRGGAVPRRPRRRSWARPHLRRPRDGAGGPPRGLRARGRVADRAAPTAQGGASGHPGASRWRRRRPWAEQGRWHAGSRPRRDAEASRRWTAWTPRRRLRCRQRRCGDPGRRAGSGRPRAAHGSGSTRRAHRCGSGWVPRRAGDRGAVEAGLLPSLLPGGRPVATQRPASMPRRSGASRRFPRHLVVTCPACSRRSRTASCRRWSRPASARRPAGRGRGGASANDVPGGPRHACSRGRRLRRRRLPGRGRSGEGGHLPQLGRPANARRHGRCEPNLMSDARVLSAPRR